MKVKSLAAFLFVLIASPCFQLGAQTAQSLNDQAKIARLLEESKLTYSKVRDGVWVVAYNGESTPDFNVVVSGQKDLVVIFAILAEKKDLKVTPDMMRIMLKLNHDLDRVKALIDDDGDAAIRIDVSLRTLDGNELAENINQVASASIQAHKALKQFITVAK